MAKSKSKETSLPLIISLVFFVLTTIGLGVFCYVLFSDMETKDAEVAKFKKSESDIRAQLKDAELVARVQRVYFGVEKDDDQNTVETDVKEGTPAFNELKRLNEVTAAKIAKLEAETNTAFNQALNKALLDAVDETARARQADPKAPVAKPKIVIAPIDYREDLGFWKAEMNSTTGALSRRSNNYGLLEVIVKSKRQRDLALQAAAGERTGYIKGVDNMTVATKAANDARTTFTNKADTLPDDFNKQVAAIQAQADKRKKEFDAREAEMRAELSTIKDELEKEKVKVKRQDDEIARLNTQINGLAAKIKQPDPLKYDTPQGKITRRNTDGTVEVDLGSNDRVREGLTFSILPTDYPVKGEQSRLREIRVPDGRGGFRTEVIFVPKAKIEIIEVLGPTSSKAKITEEFDDIRDKAMPGDLLYSAAWRKGASEHIALIGIFDINGDGTDDIEQVVRDFRKMGVIVDAYYDPNRKNEDGSFGGWNGTISDQTRYMVKGYFPDPTPNDPNIAKMSELNAKFAKGLEDGKRKGVVQVGLKEFFPRMGYKIRMDVTDEQIRQAARKYLDPVAAPMEPNKN